jgi:hypothetical protein
VASIGGGAVGSRAIGKGLGAVKVTGATLVVYAAKHGQTALDGEGGNSPFAVAVVQRLATPNVEINKLFRLVRDDVMEATAGRQEPYTYGSLPGREDFFFVHDRLAHRSKLRVGPRAGSSGRRGRATTPLSQSATPQEPLRRDAVKRLR